MAVRNENAIVARWHPAKNPFIFSNHRIFPICLIYFFLAGFPVVYHQRVFLLLPNQQNTKQQKSRIQSWLFVSTGNLIVFSRFVVVVVVLVFDCSAARHTRLSYQYGHGSDRGQQCDPEMCRHRWVTSWLYIYIYKILGFTSAHRSFAQ